MVHYFGQIVDGVMVLNDMGRIVNDEIINIPNHRKNVHIDQFIVMPNHIHMIIIIDDCVDNYRRDVLCKDVLRRDVLSKRLYDT